MAATTYSIYRISFDNYIVYFYFKNTTYTILETFIFEYRLNVDKRTLVCEGVLLMLYFSVSSLTYIISFGFSYSNKTRCRINNICHIIMFRSWPHDALYTRQYNRLCPKTLHSRSFYRYL